ncbi:MAG: glycosyltransferase family 2 protein [Eubacteriaceae bacterium]|jgi:glycosyltransferase involved in cell wall biosynthesis
MKSNIDLLVREPSDSTVKIRGWVLADYVGDEAEIHISADEPIEDVQILREDRPDLDDPTGKNARVRAGFIIEVKLRELKGKLKLDFTTPLEHEQTVLNLNLPYCEIHEAGSPSLLAIHALAHIKPYLTRNGRKLLKRKLMDNVPGLGPDYQEWIRENEGKGNPERIQRRIDAFAEKPLISLAVPVYNVKPEYLKKLVESVENQQYQNWELCLADDCSTDRSLIRYMESLPESDSRIKVDFRKENGHICRASNIALDMASGEFVGLLDHDDELAPNALYEVVSLLNEQPGLDLIYSDEDKIDARGKRSKPYFKSDYAPDSLLAGNYICHFSVFRKELLDQIGGFRPGYEGAQDHDLILRAVEQTDRIAHIPKILYHWRMLPESTAAQASAKNYAYDSGIKAVSDALERRGTPGTVTPGKFPGIYDVAYDIVGNPKVSVIVPTRDNPEVLKRCIDSVCQKTDYSNYEIVIADNGSVNPETMQVFKDLQESYPQVKVVRIDIPFNYSRINNLAVQHATGEYLLFLNDDTEVVAPEWMRSMLGFAQHDYTGAVGAKLLYPDDTIQHAGVVLGIGGIAGHIHYHYPKDDPGYFSKLAAVTNYSCVTAACLMLDRKKFEQVGGFDENIAVAFNDVDLCCALTDAGYYGVYDPAAVLYHHESVSRGYETTRAKKNRMMSEMRKVVSKWGPLLDNDPMYNPNLSLGHADFRIKTEY